MRAARERQPVIVRDIRAFILAQRAFAPIYHILEQEDWHTLVSVPLTYRHRDVGILATYFAAGHDPDETEVTFLQAIAGQAAVAVENARLLIEVHGKAALEERQRLARDLHDSVSQALFGIALGTRTARTLLQQNPQAALEPLDYVLSLAEAGMAEMRALIFELRPDALAEHGLVEALTRQTAAISARTGLDIDVLGPPGRLPLSTAAEEHTYRVAMEAIANSVKHACAGAIQVTIADLEDAVTVTVADDGDGFEPGADHAGHFGLRTMRERADRIGAALDVHTSPGAGTAIRLTVPADPIEEPTP